MIIKTSFLKTSVLKMFSIHAKMEHQCFQISLVYKAFLKRSIFGPDCYEW